MLSTRLLKFMPIDSDKIRIGLMPYLKSEVFYHTLNLPGTDLSSMVPSAMARAWDFLNS